MSKRLQIERVPALQDNYLWLVREPQSGFVAIVDPADPVPVRAALQKNEWTLTHILNTHHHPDHVGGNLTLKQEFGCTIVGPAPDAARIPGIDVKVGDGDTYRFGEAEAKVFFVPGHTRGHIAYWFKDHAALFCGDTLFALGCGRLFEGTAEQMYANLQRIAALPDHVRIFCGHEYTAANVKFALTVEPENAALKARADEVTKQRAANQPTVPTLLGEEKKANVFLRADVAQVAANVGMSGKTAADVFGEIRERKNKS